MRAGRAQKLRESIEAPTVVEAGFTLIEVLISLTILSVVIIVVVGGMNTLVISSVISHNQNDAGAVVRRAAEAVRGDGYVQCASLNATAYSMGMPATANLLPENAAGQRVNLPTILKITSFDGTKTFWSPATGTQNCAGNSTALQVVQIQDVTFQGNLKQFSYVVKSP